MKIMFNKKSLIALAAIISSISFTNIVTATNDDNNNNKIVEENLPIGSVVMWGSNTIPENWLLLNGQSTGGHAELVAIFGGTLPDMRGKFARGTGGNAAVIGTTQAEMIKGHSHTATFTGNQLPPHSHPYTAYSGATRDGGAGGSGADNKKQTRTSSSVSGGIPTGTVSINSSSVSGAETIPKNVALNYIVKFK